MMTLLHPSTQAALSLISTVPLKHVTHHHLYTDGSFSTQHSEESNQQNNTWCFAIIQEGFDFNDQHNYFHAGFFSGPTTPNKQSPDWIGTVLPSAIAGEAEALTHALLYTLAHLSHDPNHTITLQSDALNLVNYTSGTFHVTEKHFTYHILNDLLATVSQITHILCNHTKADIGHPCTLR